MKFKMNTKTMTPHDAAGKFFPDFSRLIVNAGGKSFCGHCVLDIDDKGRAVLSFEHVFDEQKEPEPSMSVGRVFRR